MICPAFVSDCLETLEEIGLRGRETFLAAGGKEFALIPCLNEHPLWLEALERMIAAVYKTVILLGGLPVKRECTSAETL